MSRLLLDLGVAVSAHRTAALSCLAALALAVVLAWQSGAVRQRAVLLAWRVPGLGPRLRTLALARLYRCLGLLAAAGVPIPQALRLAHPVLAAPLQPALVHTAAALDSGQRLSQALQNNGLATPVARRMLRVGEGSGALPAMLERAAAFHDEELAELADLVSRFVNPVLMLVMGTVIGGIVVLMYLPIFTLMEQVP
jgi:general secretion pathway protein F